MPLTLPRASRDSYNLDAIFTNYATAINNTETYLEARHDLVTSSVATVAALRALTAPAVNTSVITRGYATDGDKGWGTWRYDAASTATDNNGTVVKPTGIGGGSPGRWHRVFDGTTFFMTWFGAVGDGVANDTQPWLDMMTQVNATTKGVGYMPAGKYLIDWFPANSASLVTLGDSRALIGAGPNLTEILMSPTSLTAYNWLLDANVHTARLMLVDSRAFLYGFSINGQKSLVDRNAVVRVNCSAIRSNTGAQSVITANMIIKDLYMQTRKYTISAIDTTTEVVTTSTAHSLGTGDEVKFSSMGTAAVSIDGGTPVSVSGLIGVVIAVPTTTTFILDGWDFTASSTGGTVTSTEDTVFEGFALTFGADASYCYAENVTITGCDSTAFACGGTVDATNASTSTLYGFHTYRNCQAYDNGRQAFALWRVRGVHLYGCFADRNWDGFNFEFTWDCHVWSGYARFNGQFNCKQIGYGEDCGFHGVACDGAGRAEFGFQYSSSNEYKGAPQRITVENIQFGPNTTKHMRTVTADTANHGTNSNPSGTIKCAGVENWVTYNYYFNNGTQTGMGNGGWQGSWKFESVERNEYIRTHPLPAWLPSSGAITSTAYTGGGNLGFTPITLTTTTAGPSWQGNLRKAHAVLITGRYQIQGIAVTSVTAATDVFVTTTAHNLATGDTVSFNGTVTGTVSISGAASTSIAYQRGTVATVPSSTSFTVTNWNILTDGAGGKCCNASVIHTVRLIQATPTISVIKYQNIVPRGLDIDQWQTFELPVNFPNITNEYTYAVDYRRTGSSTTTQTFVLDYINVYSIAEPTFSWLHINEMRHEATLKEEFFSGTATSNQIGELGWNYQAGTSGTIGFVGSEANHPGIIRMFTGTTAGTYSVMRTTGVLTQIDPAWYWSFWWWFKIATAIDAQTIVRLGMGNDNSANPPGDYIAIEKKTSGTNFRFTSNVGGGGSPTDTDTTIALDTGWHCFNAWKYSSTQIACQIDTNVPILLAASVPTALISPFAAVGNGTDVTSKQLYLDAFALKVAVNR